MGKERAEDPAERAARKAEKKARKEAKESGKVSEAGVTKPSSAKKSKKEKSTEVAGTPSKSAAGEITVVVNQSKAGSKKSAAAASSSNRADSDEEDSEEDSAMTGQTNGTTAGKNEKAKAAVPQGALVPFANPLAEEKTCKKVLKGVRKANKSNALKRGVKEVVKHLRKSATPAPSTSYTPPYICILAADISPMDVISHLPVLCEDHSIPYIFVPSRADLGAAGSTKRPTSVVLITKESKARRKAPLKKVAEQAEGDGMDLDAKEDGDELWDDTYKDILKVVQKAGKSVRI